MSELNSHTRFIARRMRVQGDVAGADSVLCWQLGYPFSVNLSRGYPRYNPGEFTANDLLERKEVDAILMVGAEGFQHFSESAISHFKRIPQIVLDPPGSPNSFTASVRFNTATFGVHRPGTAYRMDEIPIPLRSFLRSDLPSDDEVLHQIEARL